MTEDRKIIVVEDDASMSQAIERLLKAAGWQPRIFGSAEALLDSGLAQEAACFLFNIELPGLSGLELRKRLEESGIDRPTFFTTAYDQSASREQARGVAAGYFPKPFDGPSLLKAITASLLCFLIGLLFWPAGAQAQGNEVKRVLIVHSFGSAAPPFSVHALAFETELVTKMGGRVDLDEVSLDMARYADPEMQDAVVEYLEKRQLKWRPDLVVPIGSPAGKFVANYRERLWPDTPILYASLDRRLLPPGALEKNATYVGQIFDVDRLIEDMLQAAPATKNIAVIVGASPLEQHWKGTFQKAAAPLAGRINFIYFDDLSFDQMLAKAKTLPPDSYIFLLLLLRDAAGVTHNADLALARLHEVANAPINSIFEHQMGLGIVGGRLYQSRLIGKEAAGAAIRILRGEPPSTIEAKLIEPLPRQYDWRELERWNIDENRLPPGSAILFRSPSVWREYRGWILLGGSILIGQAVLIFALLVNLIRRRRAERSLSESEERFRVTADAAPVLLWMSGPDKECTFLNKGWLEFTGRPPEEQLGDGWRAGVHPDDVAHCLETYSSAFDAREPFAMQYRLQRHDGEYCWITDNGVPRYDARGTFVGYAGVCVDISDLLNKDAERKQAEELFRLAIEASPSGTLLINDKGRIVLLNAHIEELFGYGRDELIGKSAQTLVPPRFAGEYSKLRESFLAAPEVRGIGAGPGICGLRKDGTEFPVEIGLSPIQTPKGFLVLANVVDVSARKAAEAEAQLRRDQVELLSRVSLLGEMAASLAHELNQPLSAIVSNASAGMRFIDKGDVDLETLREIMVDVEGDGRRAHEIVASVRQTIKKGKNGNRNRQPIDLNDTIGRVVHMVQPDATAYSCEIETALAGNLPRVEGDPVQIQQVLINLMSNAFDSMRETARAKRKVRITTEPNDHGTIRVSVRDRGSGIPGAIREQMFDQFVSTKEEGLGMGLAIVRSIIEAHGGEIGADNQEGGGARFYFTLPTTENHLS